jgi:hypothetical protein
MAWGHDERKRVGFLRAPVQGTKATLSKAFGRTDECKEREGPLAGAQDRTSREDAKAALWRVLLVAFVVSDQAMPKKRSNTDRCDERMEEKTDILKGKEVVPLEE